MPRYAAPVPEWSCLDSSPGCREDALCTACYGRELFTKRPMAGSLGFQWAERLARLHPELRSREAWPVDGRSLAIARRKVASLARDPRLVEELAKACVAGAAGWWARRPARYR